jgi:hypothetical protein
MFLAIVVHKKFEAGIRALRRRESVLMRTKCMFSKWTTCRVKRLFVWLSSSDVGAATMQITKKKALEALGRRVGGHKTGNS